MSTQAVNSSCEAQAHSNIFQDEFQGKLALRPREAARLLGIGNNAIYTLCHRADFPAVKVGCSTFIIPVDALRRWLDAQTGEGVI
jgi:excisionase family DNA binding protein